MPRTASGATRRVASCRPTRRVATPHRLTPGLAVRVGVMGAVAIAVFAALFFRLWSLQVLSGARYLDAAQNNQLRTIRVEAPRGPILDRNGAVIVGNVPGTAVKLWVGDMPKKAGRYAMIRRLADVLDVPVMRLAREVDGRRADPLTPITVKTAVHDDQVNYLLEHQASGSRASRSSRPTCATTRTSHSPRSFSATSARSPLPS